MKVFLSWSGETSKAAATALHSWLPTVIQTVRPYMSAESIDKGERWSVDISKQLEDTHFGIICVTPENLEAPWVLFEAGALSKSMEKARVSPLLFGVGPTDFTGSPLLQFQLTLFKKNDFLKLLNSINSAAPDNERLTPDVLSRSFERAWAEIEQEIAKVDFRSTPIPKKAVRHDPATDKLESVLDELLTIARSQMKVLRSPEDLLPRGYLAHALEGTRFRSYRPPLPATHAAWKDLGTSLSEAIEQIEKGNLPEDLKEQLEDKLRLARSALRFIQGRLYEDRDFARPFRRPATPDNSSEPDSSDN